MAYDAFDLSGKVAVVTGGNGGIGLGFAKAVAAAGADVSIWGTNPEKNAAAEKELREFNPSASATICDVSNESAVEEAMAGVIERYGRVDACFPNAGIGTQNQKPFFEHSNEDWFSVIDVNLHGVFYTLRAATRQMVEQGEGGHPRADRERHGHSRCRQGPGVRGDQGRHDRHDPGPLGRDGPLQDHRQRHHPRLGRYGDDRAALLLGQVR